MNIVLFGEDIFTATVLQSLVEDEQIIVHAVICPVYPNNFGYRVLKNAAARYKTPFFHKTDINDSETEELLSQIKPDFIISVHLRKILTKRIYSLAGYALNLHPSILPKYRGLSPQHQCLINGDAETGVTIHLIEETIDTGDIVIQEKIALTKEMYVFDLHVKMLEVYKYITRDAIYLLKSKNFKPVKQSNLSSSWYGSLKKDDRRIDLKKTKFDVYNLIRAVSKPYKGAFYDNIIIWRAYVPDADKEKFLLNKYSGNGIYIIGDEENEVLIRLADGVLLSDDFEDTNQ